MTLQQNITVLGSQVMHEGVDDKNTMVLYKVNLTDLMYKYNTNIFFIHYQVELINRCVLRSFTIIIDQFLHWCFINTVLAKLWMVYAHTVITHPIYLHCSNRTKIWIEMYCHTVWNFAKSYYYHNLLLVS